MSKMIFCCDFWWRSSYPRFYEKTVALMKGANGKAFLNEGDMFDFIDILRKQIESDKPKGHAAHITYTASNTDGRSQVYLESGKDETDIARLYLHRVNSIVTYGDLRQIVFDVVKRNKP